MTTLREGIAEIAEHFTMIMTPAELRTWRLAHRMTQSQASEWVGVSRRSWIRYEQPSGHRDYRPVPRWLRIIVVAVPASSALHRLNTEG